MTDDGTQNLERRTFLKATGAAGAAAAVGVTNVTAGRDKDLKEQAEEVVVNLDAAAETQTAEVEVQQALPEGADVVHRNNSLNYLAVSTPKGASPQARKRLMSKLEKLSSVYSAERNRILKAHEVDDPRLDEQYAPQQVNAPQAWEKTLGSEDIEVAIIDSGVNWTHEDLADQFGENKGEDFSGNGGDPPAEGERHGTHVAGIASATTDNGTGTAGMSNSRIYSVRSLGGGRGSLTDIADGIDWAAQKPVDVINMSLGGGGRTDLLKNAVSNAYSEGVLIFTSAGNSGPEGDTVAYPAKYEECIAVSALAEGEDIARFSSRGPEVEITGPGAQVLSTLPGDDYGPLSGTSMSCPAVTGVGALAFAWAEEQGQDFSNDEMRALMKETARDVGLSENEQGSGCADASRLLDQIGPVQPTGELTFNDQLLGEDGAVTVTDVSAGQPSAVVVTYADGDQNIIAGLSTVGEIDEQDVDVAIEDAGGFPGEHTAWIFDAEDVPEGVGVGDDASPVADAALDSETAVVSEPTEGLDFSDQVLGDDGAVTVSNVVSNQASTVVVTYADGDQNIIAGLAAADNLGGENVDVTIEDAGGFPGEHTAWLFADADLPDVGIGDDATPVAGDAIDSDTAVVSEEPQGLTFNDQILGDDGAVTVSDVASNQASTVVVTYADGDQNIIAGLAAADNLDGADVDVAIEDAGGFPGEHTAWLFADADLPDVGVGDDATPVAGDAIASDSAVVSDEPQGPEAVIEASTTEPSVGEDVELDGTSSSSPNGEIVEYNWNAEPGGSVTSPTAVLSRDEAVTVDVTLTVEDEEGETGSTTQTFEFSDGGDCGDETAGGSADGTITWWNSSDRYSYSPRTENPCQLTISLDGPRRANFDLYVTLDGRRPTPRDYDRAGETPNADEQVVIDDLEDVSDVRILVQGVSGWGNYTISAEEIGF